MILIRLVQPPREERWVDLWPLCDYGRAVRRRGEGARPAQADSPMVYIRAERTACSTRPSASDLPHSENRDRDVVAQFQALFALEKDRVQLDHGDATDFEADLRRDAAALVGRVGEIEQAVDLLKRTQSGVLWLSGKGGIGKSFFTARLAIDPSLTGDPKKVCRIAWRFQASDQNRCNRVAFFRHAVGPAGGVAPRQEGLRRDPRRRPAVHPAPRPARRGRRPRHLPARIPGAAPRVVFVLDGLDEIARGDPDFASVPFLLSRTNVVWLCSGRPEGDLPDRFTPDRCTFPTSVLPRRPAGDVRRRHPRHAPPGLRPAQVRPARARPRARRGRDANVTNAAVEAVVARAGGLPLYVRFVIQDLLADEFHVDALDRLPPA